MRISGTSGMSGGNYAKGKWLALPLSVMIIFILMTNDRNLTSISTFHHFIECRGEDSIRCSVETCPAHQGQTMCQGNHRGTTTVPEIAELRR